jgi:hypothetical protein
MSTSGENSKHDWGDTKFLFRFFLQPRGLGLSDFAVEDFADSTYRIALGVDFPFT